MVRLFGCWATYKKPSAHSSTFGFANAQSRNKNQKSLNFANAQQNKKLNEENRNNRSQQ